MKQQALHALFYALGGAFFLFLLHHIPVNQIFIDPFSEAIKSHDLMDIAFSKFRNHEDPSLYDPRIFVINSEITDREKIAQVVDFLDRKNVSVIGMDLLFDTVYYNKPDSLLQQAFNNCDQLVLGYTFSESLNQSESTLALRSDQFFSKNKQSAYVNLATNDGFSVRAFEPFHQIEREETMAFAVKIASIYQPEILNQTPLRSHEKEWINFKRLQPGDQNMRPPINSKGMIHYSMYSINQILEDSASFDTSYFQGKIALIGFCGENDNALSMKDRYFTPLNEQYTGRSIPDMHGVIIHANILSMILDKDFIYDIPNFMIYLLSIFLLYINYFIYKVMAPKDYFRSIPYIRLIQIAEFFILLGICLGLLLYANTKLGFIFLATTIIISYELFELYEHKLKAHLNSLLQLVEDWLQRNSFTKRR